MYLNRLIIMYFLLISFAFLSPLPTAAAADDEMIIKSLPENILFSISKMATGRSESRTITIQNSGKQNFNYMTSVTLKSSSDLLYNKLLIKVSDKKHVLYSGKLVDLKKLDPRFLSKSASEQLFLKVEAPTTLGNELQGLDCELEFRFTSQGILAGVPVTPGVALPSTSTNMFNLLGTGFLLILGGIFIQFHLQKRRQMVSSK